MRALITRLCGVTLPIRTVGLTLHRWGLKPQRPMKRAIEQDAAALRRWQQEVYPQIAERAKKEDAVIYWADETAVQQDAHWVRGYAPPGKTPVRAQASQRTKLTLISALTNPGRMHFTLQEAPIDTAELRRLDCTRDKQTLREKAHAFLQYVQHTPERVKGYFKHKTLEYIVQSGSSRKLEVATNYHEPARNGRQLSFTRHFAGRYHLPGRHRGSNSGPDRLRGSWPRPRCRCRFPWSSGRC